MKNKKCLIVGAGPSGLLAAYILASSGIEVHLFERRPAAGRKLLIAGSSGLNISYDAPREEFPGFYRERAAELEECLEFFGKDDWLDFIYDLGVNSFLGTSRRYFVEGMTAAPLLKAWLTKLEELGVQFHFNKHLQEIKKSKDALEIRFADSSEAGGDALLLALGGASYEEEFPSWVAQLRGMGIAVSDLRAANCGYELVASPEFYAEAEGKAIKGVALSTVLGEKSGELMITRYGLEGTPVYTVGCSGPAHLDLKPDLPLEKLASRLQGGVGDTWQRVQRNAKLSPGALALAKFLAPPGAWDSDQLAAHALKHFPIQLASARPIEEAISTAGGVVWEKLGAGLNSLEIPGLFFAGEMVDWDAPTGGFLLTACASTAAVAASAILDFLENSR